MSNLKLLPDEIAQLYPMSNDWLRDIPWTMSSRRRDSLDTTYSRSSFGPQTVRVIVPRAVFYNAHAALWDIANQLRLANNAERDRSRPGKRRRPRPGKRMRQGA